MEDPVTDKVREGVAGLIPHLKAMTAFAQKRIGNPSLASDVVQDALLKAVQHAPELRDDDHLVAWAYRILRNTITDALRRRGVEPDHNADLADLAVPDERAAEWCRCIEPLIDLLKPEYAEVLRDDLAGMSLDETAKRLGIDMGNLKVRRHRARAALRERLETTCRVCARHGCLDCHCAEAPEQHR